MKKVSFIMKYFVLIMLILPFSIFAQRLHLEGSKIRNEKNEEIILRGFNWGWWGEAIPADGKQCKELGANCIRTSLRWHYWGSSGESNPSNARLTSAPGHINPIHLAILDSTIQWATKNRLWVVLFVNSDQGAGDNAENFYTSPNLKQEYIEMWKFLAVHFKNTPYIAAFEIMAEPHFERAKYPVSNTVLRNLYKEIIDSILPLVSNTPFVIGPQNYYNAESLTDEYLLPDYQIIYAANHFYPNNYASGTAPYGYPSTSANKQIIEDYYSKAVAFKNRNNVPVWADQFGASWKSNGYIDYAKDLVNYFEQNSISWTYWTWRTTSGTRGIWERRPTNKDPYILDSGYYDFFKSTFNAINSLTSTRETAIPNVNYLIYPNPNNRTLFIQLAASQSSSMNAKNIEITDMMGRTVLTQPIQPSIEINHLNEGLYFVRIGDFIQKLVIQKEKI